MSRKRGPMRGAWGVPGGPGLYEARPRSGRAYAGGARPGPVSCKRRRGSRPRRGGSRATRGPATPRRREAHAVSLIAIRRPMDGTPWPQSALAPDGPAARAILEIGWVLTGLSGFVVLLVAAALLIATLRRHDYEATAAPLPVSPDLVRKIRGERESLEPTPGESLPLEAQAGAGLGRRREVRRDTLPDDQRGVRWILAGGVAFPVVVLVPLFVLTMRSLAAVEARDVEPDLTIEVIGR